MGEDRINRQHLRPNKLDPRYFEVHEYRDMKVKVEKDMKQYTTVKGRVKDMRQIQNSGWEVNDNKKQNDSVTGRLPF